MSSLLRTVDDLNKFEDLSGVDSTAYANPYDALIEACQDDPVRVFISLMLLRNLPP